MKRINKVNDEYSFMLTETGKLYDARIKGYMDNLITAKWQFIAVEQQRGVCYYGHKVITIPMYAIRKGIDHTTYYLAHEMAHAYAGYKANHGPLFMEWLAKICPIEWQYMEYEYKPRHAANAGLAISNEMLMRYKG